MATCDFLSTNGFPPKPGPDLQDYLYKLVTALQNNDSIRTISSATEPSTSALTALWGGCTPPEGAIAIWSDGENRFTYSFMSGSWSAIMSPNIPPAWPTGSIVAYSGEIAPGGWLICDGSPVSRITYASLFNVIGTKWGVGNGSTTFNLPDFRGRVPVGSDTMGTTPANRLTEGSHDTIGSVGGVEKHKLTEAELPPHTHDVKYNGRQDPGAAGTLNSVSSTGSNILKTEAAGGNLGHYNVQPYAIVYYIIKT